MLLYIVKNKWLNAEKTTLVRTKLLAQTLFKVGMVVSRSRSLIWVTTTPLLEASLFVSLADEASIPEGVGLGAERPEAKVELRAAASCMRRIFVVWPIPSCGNPRFRPSRSRQALQSSLDEM